jgi:DNA-binding MarR family transcriptional regulator
MLVLRQLTAVLDRKLAEVTRRMNLTPHDVLVLGWMEQIPGISGSNIAGRVGRTRQNIQSSLERLERRGLAVKYTGPSGGRGVGWGLTNQGSAVWCNLLAGFQVQEAMLVHCGLTRQFINGLDDLNTRMARNSPSTAWGPGLIDVAQETELSTSEVSGEVELPAESDEV